MLSPTVQMQPHNLSKEKKKMQFTKIFKVIFTMGLVKGVTLAPAKLHPLFSLRIANSTDRGG